MPKPQPVDLPFRRIAFLGFGLIGGSIAMALRERAAPVHVTAWSPAGRGPRSGLDRGLVDVVAESPADGVRGADLVILAGPPLAVTGMLADSPAAIANGLGSTTVTDVASTKATLLRRANDGHVRFVGGHPMAGKELSGVEAASGNLFVGRPWVVVPGDFASPDDVERVESLARFVGAVPVRMTAAEHDAAVAAISHVPLAVAAALVEAVANGDPWRLGKARQLAASGWRDTTRVAHGDPEMGAGIFATNASEVASGLRRVRDAIDEWIADLERDGCPDAARFRARLEAARNALTDSERAGRS
ncbi:MAG TPA: prephenate dehydrogenase/arogenate dehydrogenase family protein [Candidatus Limnocylindrales bacterium]|jgi:prephenate dehydrogenase